jgi:hypothetical protein
MNTVRVERRLIGGHRTRMDVRGVLVVASMCAVFACAFAAGRATSAGPVSHVEDSSSVPAAAAGAVIPVRLSTAPPLQLAPPPKPKPTPPVRHIVPAVSIRPVAPPEAAHAEAAQPEPAPATPAPAQPAAPVAREPAPAPAPTPAPAPAPAAKQPSAPSTGAPAGGGSFESSG